MNKSLFLFAKIIYLKYIFIFIIFFSFTEILNAQQTSFWDKKHSKVAFILNGQAGKIVKHTQRFQADVTQPSFHLEAGVAFKTFGEKAWQRKLHYPEMGISYIYTHYGDRAVFGQAHGLLPHIRFSIKRTKLVDVYFRIGSGIAYNNTPFHPVDNPTNNVIGSKINNVTQLRFGSDFHLSESVDLTLGFTFTHHSNARTQSPNLGTNIPAISIGARYMPFEKRETINQEPIPKPEKRNSFLFRTGMGITSRAAVGGPKYPVYTNTFMYARHTSVANRVWIGATWALNMAKHDRILDQETFDNIVYRASDLSIFIGDEILMGKIGMFFLVGAYLFEPEFKNPPIYAKLGMHYYFVELGKSKDIKPFVGVNLKTHYSVAEYAEFTLGLSF